MSFNTLETSNYDAQPISLFEFNIADRYWRYTSDQIDTAILGVDGQPIVYKSTSISDSGVIQSGDAQTDDMTVKMPSTEAFASLFVATPPSGEAWLTIRRMHHGETEAPVIWVGTVESGKLSGLRTMQFTCKILTASFNRNGLRMSWSRQCLNALYDRNCRVPKEAYAVAMKVEEIFGTVFRSAGFQALPVGWFNNGFVEYVTAAGLLDRRAIEFNNQREARILGTTEGIVLGSFVKLYPGCGRNTHDCVNKFANMANYGGFPHMPGKSPFDGNPIY